MAGDWIKFEVVTSDKPEVFVIANELNIDPDAVVGKLLRIWAWFDSHSTDGNAPSVTTLLLDRITGVTGFCDAVIKAQWLIQDGENISLPNFNTHNGQTAKKRALAKNRQHNHRNKSNANSNDGSVTKPSLEKRREDIKQHNTNDPKARTLIPKDFKADKETIEYAIVRSLPDPTNQELIDDFINKNESSNWMSANWQAELKRFLPKYKLQKNKTSKQISKPVSAVDLVEQANA